MKSFVENQKKKRKKVGSPDKTGSSRQKQYNNNNNNNNNNDNDNDIACLAFFLFPLMYIANLLLPFAK